MGEGQSREEEIEEGKLIVKKSVNSEEDDQETPV